VLDPNGPIYFELVAHGRSMMMQFDPFSRKVEPAVGSTSIHPSDSVRSPDGRRIAFTSDADGSQQILLKDLASGRVSRFTSGNCNNSEPAWDLNSNAIVFASDCGRAVGLSALYRVDVVAPRSQ
jgi:Tol biopolymer transport system component